MQRLLISWLDNVVSESPLHAFVVVSAPGASGDCAVYLRIADEIPQAPATGNKVHAELAEELGWDSVSVKAGSYSCA